MNNQHLLDAFPMSHISFWDCNRERHCINI